MMKKTHKMEISIWEKDGEIHISLGGLNIEGVTGISTINDKEGSKRCHQHLYNQLKKVLENNGKWRTGK